MDVALIQWPSDETLRIELQERRKPRLLLVEAGAAPPQCLDTLEDWVRLPVSPSDRRARMLTLQQRADGGGSVTPTLTEDGGLEFRGSTTQLSGHQADLARVMIDRFGAVVSRETLYRAAWPDRDLIDNNLDVTVGRLRRRLGQIGLQVRTVRSRGYLLVPDEGL